MSPPVCCPRTPSLKLSPALASLWPLLPGSSLPTPPLLILLSGFSFLHLSQNNVSQTSITHLPLFSLRPLSGPHNIHSFDHTKMLVVPPSRPQALACPWAPASAEPPSLPGGPTSQMQPTPLSLSVMTTPNITQARNLGVIPDHHSPCPLQSSHYIHPTA